jgi:hypothetical protein
MQRYSKRVSREMSSGTRICADVEQMEEIRSECKDDKGKIMLDFIIIKKSAPEKEKPLASHALTPCNARVLAHDQQLLDRNNRRFRVIVRCIHSSTLYILFEFTLGDLLIIEQIECKRTAVVSYLVQLAGTNTRWMRR